MSGLTGVMTKEQLAGLQAGIPVGDYSRIEQAIASVASNPVSALAASTALPAAGTTLTGGPLSGKMLDYGGMFYNVMHPTIGLKGNANSQSDGAITNATNIFSSASTVFTAADIGKSIVINGAGVAGALLTTTISGFTNATTVTLAANASTTVSGTARFTYGTDDSALANTFIAAVPSGSPGIAIWFPTARYLMVANPLTVNGRTDIQLFGSGPNSTMILSGANADTVLFTGTFYRISMTGFWVGSFGVRTAGFGINVNGNVGSPSRDVLLEHIIIENTFRAANFVFVQHSRAWDVKYIQSFVGATGAGGLFYFQSVLGGNFRDFDIQTTSGNLGTDNAKFGGDGLVIDSNCDSVEFQGWNIVGGGGGFGAGNGILFNNSAGGSGPRLIRLLNMWVESWPNMGINFNGACRDVRLKGCHTWVNSQRGVYITLGTRITLEDHSSCMNQQHGIHVIGGTAIQIVNPTCSDNSQVADSTWDGIRVDNAMVGNVDITGGKSGNFIFGGANQQQWGLRVGAADATDNVFAVGLDVRGNRNAAGALVSTTATTGNIRLQNCPGFNPVGVVTLPAFPGTSVDVFNSTGVDLMVYITSGTNAITAIKLGGTTVTGLTVGAGGALSAPIPWPAGQKINLTYVAGGVPSWQGFN